ncbi:hypothetical protein FB45DRAFT_865941 [Roridomyces roridus]|uniref:Uncharacterized protein n=1 Tax=Roridomyces roridus TaxID=1738132 RepID=A0AAD7BVI1_9AGAR|nr:hypothetical protein FB45DRAFT_865941 [Roridomyces roridus]
MLGAQWLDLLATHCLALANSLAQCRRRPLLDARAHWLPPLLPSPPLLDVCIGPLFPFSPLLLSPPLLGTHWRGPILLMYDCSSASPPPRLAVLSSTRHPIHENYLRLSALHLSRALPPFLGSSMQIRTRHLDRCRPGVFAVPLPRWFRLVQRQLDLQPPFLHLRSEIQHANNIVPLRARWMDPVSTERLGRSNPVAPASSLRPCLAGFHSSSWPPLGLSPFTVGSWVRQDGIQSVSDLVHTAACEMDGRSWDGQTWVQIISIPVAPASPLRTCLASERFHYDDSRFDTIYQLVNKFSKMPATGTDAPLLGECLCWAGLVRVSVVRHPPGFVLPSRFEAYLTPTRHRATLLFTPHHVLNIVE